MGDGIAVTWVQVIGDQFEEVRARLLLEIEQDSRTMKGIKLQRAVLRDVFPGVNVALRPALSAKTEIPGKDDADLERRTAVCEEFTCDLSALQVEQVSGREERALKFGRQGEPGRKQLVVTQDAKVATLTRWALLILIRS